MALIWVTFKFTFVLIHVQQNNDRQLIGGVRLTSLLKLIMLILGMHPKETDKNKMLC